ncbi:MAG: T9SS type A sorting domain-containing protein [Ignavibacterium sp.]|jgi:hypothetical protein|nr:T9SS type A sorting domain-containing protein [Ignavibacterium sp.]
MLRLFKLLLLVFFSIYTNAQTDPNTDPNWDWINGDYPNAPYPSSQYRMFIANYNGQIVEAPITAPWGQGNAWIGLQDMKREDGWKLVSRDFGTPSRYVWAPYQEGAPYFILYNRYKGILRFFIMVKSNQDLTSGALELKFHADNTFKTATLTHLKPRAYATDKLANVQNNAGLALSQVMNDNWAWADYPMAFDPTFVATENGAWLDFQVVGTIESEIKISGTATGINGTQKEVRDFMTGTNNGAVTLTTDAPAVNSTKSFSQFTTSVFGTASSWDKWKQTIIDFAKKQKPTDNTTKLGQENNKLKGFIDNLENSWLLKGLPYIGAAVGLVDFLTGGGQKTKQTVKPTFTGLNLSLTGSITTTLKLPNPKRIQVPSSKLNPNLAVYGSTTPIVYNENFGVLNLTSTPIIKYKTYFQSYGNGTSRQYMDCQLQDNLQFSVNPASGLILDSMMAYIVMDPSQNVMLENPTADPDLNLLATWASVSNPKIALETSSDGKFIFRSRVVPYDAFKYQRVQGPIGNYTPDITIKIKAVLHRSDDPLAQPVLMIVTYEPELVADGTGNYPEPFYVRVTRDFEFDTDEVQQSLFGFVANPISVSTPATIGSYIFAGWSDGVMSTSRQFTSNTDIRALYKKINNSNNANTYSNNNQRKIVRTQNGELHKVYESMDRVWYERSVDNGASWSIVMGKPLSTLKSISPSIDYYQNDVFIVFQEINNDKFNIKTYTFQNGDPIVSLGDVASNRPYSNAFDATPVVAFTNSKLLVVWKDDFHGTMRLVHRLGTGYGSFYSSFCQFIDTDINSTNPCIVGKKSTGNIIFHMAFQQGENKIYYKKLSVTNNEISSDNIVDISTQSPYSKNYKPSLIVLLINGVESVRFSWIGEKIPNKDGCNVVFRALSGTSLSAYWNFGSSVLSTNINSTDDMNYIVGWSDGFRNDNYYVRNTTLSAVKTFKKNNTNLRGRSLQVVNGSNFSNQFGCIFANITSPYQFTVSDPISSLGKENLFSSISIGREGIVTKDSANYFFTLGDITVDGNCYDFTPIDETTIITNYEELNSYLISEPFQLNDGSSFTYSVQYGVTDSVIANQVLGEQDFILFKVQLIDSQSGEVLGTYDQVQFSSNNVIQYENIAYEVETEGIGSRMVQLKLIILNNINPYYTLASKYATENTLMKKNFKQMYFNGKEIIKEFELSQNFPNPFNPNTTIRYQIPKSGNVTLKIYDVLGAEVTTLVNEEKVAGKYEVSFNASKLASGVYIYRIQAGDFISSKKMILLK